MSDEPNQAPVVPALQKPADTGPGFATRQELRGEPGMPEERSVYGCVGADRPEAQPFIEEVDGILAVRLPEMPGGAGQARRDIIEEMTLLAGG